MDYIIFEPILKKNYKIKSIIEECIIEKTMNLNISCCIIYGQINYKAINNLLLYLTPSI